MPRTHPMGSLPPISRLAPAQAVAARYHGATAQGLRPHQQLRDALRLLQRGSVDVALAAGTSALLPQLHAAALHVATVAGATAVAAQAAQRMQHAFMPDVYASSMQHMDRAAEAWRVGNRDLALHQILLSRLATDQDRGCDPLYALRQRELEEVVAYALHRGSWPVIEQIIESLECGQRGYWEAIVAAHRAGLLRKMPVSRWAARLLWQVLPPITADEMVRLGDILLEHVPTVAPDWFSGGHLNGLVTACVQAAQAGQLGRADMHRLLRIAHATPGLDRRLMDGAARGLGSLRVTLLALDDAARAGRLSPTQREALLEQLRAFVEQQGPDEAMLRRVCALAEGRESFSGVSLAFAEVASFAAASHAALGRLAVAQFVSGDTPGAFATLRRTQAHAYGHTLQWCALQGALAATPSTVVQMCVAAAQAGDAEATHRLLRFAHGLAPAFRLELMDRLQALNVAHDPSGFFVDGQLPLRTLLWPRLRDIAGRMRELHHPFERPEDQALRALALNYEGPDLSAVLRAWQVAAQTPEVAAVFHRLRRHEWVLINRELAPALARGTLSDRGFLLAVHLMHATLYLSVNHPRGNALVHCQPLLKSAQRLRRLLGALAQIGATSCVFVNRQTQRLLLWPSDGQLRPWLEDACKGAQEAQLQALGALRAGTLPRAEARAARDTLEHRVESLHLHAQHVHAQGDAAGVRAYTGGLRSGEAALRAHLLRLRDLLAPGSAGLGLVQALLEAPDVTAQERAARALNDWRKGRSKEADGEVAAQVHAVASLCVQRGRILRQLRKPLPAAAQVPADFLTAHPESKAVQALHTQHILPLQIDALHALLSVDALGGDVAAHDTPQQMLAANARLLQLNDASQPAFQAMLERFRDPRLFWSLANRMRRYSAQHCMGFNQTLEHLIAGTHTEQRRASPQMQALFAGGQRDALREAWEAGAWAQVPAGKPHAGKRLHDTGAFEDIASSGDEITGSCQSLVLSMHTQYLMGRVVCGSKRMVTLKDDCGRMLARAVFRLMLDDKDRPTLLLSRVYATKRECKAESALLRGFALERARALGLPLVTSMEAGIRSVRLHCETGQFEEYWDEGNTGNPIEARVIWEPAGRGSLDSDC